jgi:hypothetical protein
LSVMRKLSFKASLEWQFFLGAIFVFFLAPAYFAFLRLKGYRIRDLRRIREECRVKMAGHDGPWLICANHLTMVDSAIIIYAMFSLKRHLFNFRCLPWNLPERDNFQKSFILTVLCYLAKCVPVHRGGDSEEMKDVMARCRYLLGEKQSLLIFPEGGRSRTGRVDVDNVSYGVGRFLESCGDCRVLCVYLRGDGQETWGTLPRRDEHFTVHVETLELEREQSGLRAQRHYAGQIIRQLARMEEAYFAFRRQRCGGFDRSGKQGEERGSALRQSRLYTR